MTCSAWTLEAPPSALPQPLDDKSPAAPLAALPSWVLAGLLLACLVPRAWTACKLEVICRDGVFYVQLAEGFVRGDVEAGLGRLRLNTYPPILAVLHGLGLDYESAAKCWGVLASSLTVLPLFGWVRRMLNPAAAVAASLLYAFHPKLIGWSPEVIRDPTFWLFWTLSLYASWRAVTELRRAWFAAAGAAIALALHTRFEGWLLYLPLMWWAGWRGRALADRRGRLLAGTALAVAVCPLLMGMANVTFLRGQPTWESGDFHRLQYVAWWWQGTAPDEATVVQRRGQLNREAGPALAAEAGKIAAPPRQRMSLGWTCWIFVNTLRRGLGAGLPLLWLLGFYGRYRLWLRRDFVVLFAMCGGVLAGMWIHLWYAQDTSSRYVLPIAILGLPCAAVGWLGLCQQTLRLRTWPALRRVNFRGAFAATLAAWLMLSAIEMDDFRYGDRLREAALGRWLLAEFGAGHRLLASDEQRLVRYYGRCCGEPLADDDEALGQLRTRDPPELVVVSRRRLSTAESLRVEALRRGYRECRADGLPPSYDWDDLLVLSRPSAATPGAGAAVEWSAGTSWKR